MAGSEHREFYLHPRYYDIAFDVRETARVGWFGDRLDQLPRTRSDGRMG